MLKKMSILLVAILLIATLTVPVYAENITEKVNNVMATGMNIASSIGVGVAVILLIVVAIKYMSAAPSDKAEIKKHIVVYVIGAVLLICASGVLQLIKTLGDEVVGTGDNVSITPQLPTID